LNAKNTFSLFVFYDFSIIAYLLHSKSVVVMFYPLMPKKIKDGYYDLIYAVKVQ